MESGAHSATMETGWGGGAAPFGASWQKTMMWIFIVTDALLFSGLLCGYAFLRQANSAPWPDRTEVFSIPFIALTDYSVDKLYALKGEIVARGVKAITGLDMPVFQKRRFQHGALRVEQLRQRVPQREVEFRKQFLAMYQ